MARPRSKTKSLPQARSDRTRAAILAAAAASFASGGLAGARTDAIAAAAGVNKAMLYYYFRDKDRLFEAVLDDHFREFNRQALEVLAAKGSARAVLLRYVCLHFDFIFQKRRYAALFQQLMMAGGRPLERLIRKYFTPRAAALDKLLKRGMRNGEFRRTDPLHTALSIIAVIVFYFSASRVLQLLLRTDVYSDANLRRRQKQVVDFIRHAIFSDPEAPVP